MYIDYKLEIIYMHSFARCVIKAKQKEGRSDSDSGFCLGSCTLVFTGKYI
jgi:hypothetical protein